jgi:hypothetical protein
VDTAIELTGAERGFIMLREESGELSFAAHATIGSARWTDLSFRPANVPTKCLKQAIQSSSGTWTSATSPKTIA